MWMAERDLRWGIVGSERTFRIFRRDFRTLASGDVRPFLLMSQSISLESATLQITKVIIYMLLTPNEELPDLATNYALHVPLYDPMTLEKTRSRTQQLLARVGISTTRSEPDRDYSNALTTGKANHQYVCYS
jgi:hypothetical protein